MSQFKPLAQTSLQPDSGYYRPYFSTPNLVKVTSSALEVMTDLRYVPAVTITVEVDAESALQKMIFKGVRSLLVEDARENVIGIITARDLVGDRLRKFMDQRGVKIGDVSVGEVMTDRGHIEVLPLNEVLHAHVGDIIETLKHSARQHALVVEDDPITGKPMIRGIFSATQIARQLGVPLESLELDYTFSKLDVFLAK